MLQSVSFVCLKVQLQSLLKLHYAAVSAMHKDVEFNVTAKGMGHPGPRCIKGA
jgi:hypothetical protein